ncbi:MAG: DUF721 domain-containing protein [Thermomonas sp.]|uniref:DciA family protein n=1 Tax=Thermomonas sp. TaxID=1971895 RepID=UPI001EB2EBD3|nr:DciA family protein [Thermomonas sp.]MBV2209412.1 DUF721 domain-containing protein [Thermomonas sp.]
MSGSRSTSAKDATPLGPRAALDALFSGENGHLLRRAQWLASIDQLLRPYLAPELAAHTRLANVHNGRLHYVADAPIWNSKLRLNGPTLVAAAQNLGLDVSSLSVRTSTALAARAQTAAPLPSMSATARAGLEATLALLRANADEVSAPATLPRSRRGFRSGSPGS